MKNDLSDLKIAISGSHGLVGSAVLNFLSTRNPAQLSRIVLKGTYPKESNLIELDIKAGGRPDPSLVQQDVVIHFAGANIATQRWTKEYKTQIRESRLKTTEVLVESMKQSASPPRLFICASAVGFFGNRPSDQILTEKSSRGVGFLADLCSDWEQAALRAQSQKTRVVCLRLGMVLSSKGGALAKMLPIFRWGLGGPLASGKQMMPWILIDEIPLIVQHIIEHKEIKGAVNVVAPGVVNNLEFTKLLAESLNRLACFPVPSFAVRLMFGEMGDQLLLSGQRVVPEILLQSGYSFLYPDLKSALKVCLKQKAQ